MVGEDKINIHYGKKYPFLCQAVYNIYIKNIKKRNLKTDDLGENIYFLKDEKVEEIKVEFFSKNASHEKHILSRDQIFAKNLDYILNTNLYYISGKGKNSNVLNVYIQTQYDEWIDFFRFKNLQKDITHICEQIDNLLQLNTFVSCHFLTLSDIIVFSVMYTYFNVSSCYYARYSNKYHNINRWFKLISCLLNFKDNEIKYYLKSKLDINKIHTTNRNEKKEEKQKNISTSYTGKLENAEKGKVVTRFPPEPSGYLHIGHAKAAFLNNYYANMYGGKMLLRFDDTNPALEDIKYEKSIIEDLENLGLKYENISYTSDYFDLIESYCIKLIKMNKAYADDTNVEEMRNQRGEGIESVNRQNSIQKNMELFEEMKKGTEIGKKNCIRAKIDMQSKNKCMRDPVLYRCIADIPHHRYQLKYKCYPTYDFACPIVDSVEGVTHALRTNEYSDRIEQYNWFISTLQLRKVYIYEFSRIAFVKTVMSKRKLKWFVENNIVENWLDPRMPTIKGILRRGLTKEALFQFILEQGPSKAGNLMQWDKLWAINKQIIDPIIPRYAAVNKKENVLLKITDLSDEVIETSRDLHMKNKSLGVCSMYYNNKMLIELEDAASFCEKEEITLIRLGNVIVTDIIKTDDNIKEVIAISNFQGDFKTTKKKIHWLPYIPQKLVTCKLYEYDHLITVDKFENDDKTDWKAFVNYNSKYETVVYADQAINALKVSDRFQFERRGYFIIDKKCDDQLHLIKIPDGKSKNMSIIGTKIDPKSLSGTRNKVVDNSEGNKRKDNH